ncbi:Phosducin-like protein C2A9.09 [Rhodotorula toruloides]|nr:Phosducin-like protein C2A9.09 [Rhodotorula toruloides]
MVAINYEEDTEFNDALRKHGIIPPKDKSSSRSPSPPPAPSSPTLSELDLDDLDIERDDAVRREDLERALEDRKRREKERLGKRKFGRVYNIGKVDYKREVTDASNEELPGEPEGWGTGVVCVLFKDRCAGTSFRQLFAGSERPKLTPSIPGIAHSVPESKKLMPIINELASLYPSTKFVSIVSDHCIENYPDKNVPTMIIYRKGQMMGQVVGLGAMNGMNATLRDVERILFAFRGIDFHNKVGYDASPASGQFASRSDATAPLTKGGAAPGEGRPEKPESDDDSGDSEDDQSFVGGGRRSGIRRGTKMTDAAKRKGGDDSDSDFDL